MEANTGILDDLTSGTLNAALVCPHCKIKGQIHIKIVKLKRGDPMVKVTLALVTLGLSSLLHALAVPKDRKTRAHCDNCHMTWYM